MTDKELAQYWLRLLNAKGFAEAMVILRELIEKR